MTTMTSSQLKLQFITRQCAETYLRDLSNGSFLLRKSNQYTGLDFFFVSVVYESIVHHYQVTKNVEDSLYYAEPEAGYATFEDFCEAHKINRGGLVCQLKDQVIFLPGLNEAQRIPSQDFSEIIDLSYLENFEWFHGSIDREEEYQRLSHSYTKHKQDGIFLVRAKSEDLFVLSLISLGEVYKYEIVRNPQTKMLKIGDNIQPFYALNDLVDFLRNSSSEKTGLQCKLLKVCKNKSKTTGFRANFNAKTQTTLGKKDKEKLAIGIGGNFIIAKKNLKMGTEKLGNGNFAKVKKGSLQTPDKTWVACAVKTLHKNKGANKEDIIRNEETLKNEAKIMGKLVHDNIVRFYGVCFKQDQLCIVMEHVVMGSLKEYVTNKNRSILPEKRIMLLMNQVCDGMKYLGSKNIVHRDLAARNVLLVSEMHAKVADFGLSRATSDEKIYYKQQSDTPVPIQWYAPESLKFQVFTSKSDVWSFAVTAWEAFSYGETPFKMITQNLVQLLYQGTTLSKPQDCSEDAYAIIKKCLDLNPENRPTFKSIGEKITYLQLNNNPTPSCSGYLKMNPVNQQGNLTTAGSYSQPKRNASIHSPTHW